MTRKSLALILCLALLISSMTAYAEVDRSERVSLTILCHNEQVPNENCDVLLALEEKLNVDLNFQIVSSGEYSTKLKVLTASNSLPDMFLFGASDIKDYLEAGMILPLGELVDKYGSEILADKAAYLKYFTVDDELWGIPRASYFYPPVLTIRTDWLKNVGKEMPTNIEEFCDVMEAFTKDDPDGNGIDDTYGMGMLLSNPDTFAFIFNAYGVSFSYGNYVDGQVVPYLLSDKFPEIIEVFRNLYSNGYMNTDFASIPPMECYEKLWNGQYGSFCFGANAVTNNWVVRYVEDPKPTFGSTVLIEEGCPAGVQEVKGNLVEGVAISSKCEHPDRAIDVLNYMCSEEGDTLLYFGIEGKHYTYSEETGYTYLEPYASDISLQRADGGLAYVYFMSRSTNNAEQRTLTQTASDSIDQAKAYPLDDAFTVGSTEIGKQKGAILNNIMFEAFANLIVSTGDVEAELQQYIDEFMDNGGEEYIAQMTELYRAENGL